MPCSGIRSGVTSLFTRWFAGKENRLDYLSGTGVSYGIRCRRAFLIEGYRFNRTNQEYQMGFWSKLWSGIFGGKKADKPTSPSGSTTSPRASTASSRDSSVRETYGVTPHDPILCHQPAGEHAYIASLRCSQGHRIRGPRLGSMEGKCSDPRHHVSMFPTPGENPAEACIVDRYELRCEGGEYSCTLYFDMYHPKAPPQPAPRGMRRA